MSSKLAVQMFTLREFTKTEKDFAESLEKVSGMGYKAVQLSAVGCMNGDSPEVDAAQARRLLDDNGLKCVATHRNWDILLNNTEAEIAFHQALGCDFAAVGGLPKRLREAGEEGFRSFVEEAKPVSEKLKAAGIDFGYHNHAHEFFRIAPGPKTAYDILIEEGGDLLNLEVDTYWVVHAGVDAADLADRLHGRVPVIHLKDKEVVEDGPVIAPIGEGNLNWDRILPAYEKAGTNWYCIEQDVCRRDPFDCLRSSYDYLTSKGM